MIIKGREITRHTFPYCIAEIGANHQGSLTTAMDLVRAAKRAGCDAVKFQKRDNKTLYTKAFFNKEYNSENAYAETYGLHREFLEFGEYQFKTLKDLCHQLEIAFLCTPFDFPSVDFLNALGIDGYKIASGDSTNIPLVRYVATLRQPMILSLGATSQHEVTDLRLTLESLNSRNYALLHCVASYPAKDRHLNLSYIRTLLKETECDDTPIGYSSHDLGKLGPVIASLLGATIIEKHFTINTAWKGTDHKMSLDEAGMTRMIGDLHRASVMVSAETRQKIVAGYERKARDLMGKVVYTSRAIAAGEEFTKDNTTLKSPAFEHAFTPAEWGRVLGRKAYLDLEAERPITPGDLA